MGSQSSTGHEHGPDVGPRSSLTSRRGWVIAAVGGIVLSIWTSWSVDAAETTRHQLSFALWANERTQVLRGRETIPHGVGTPANSHIAKPVEFDRFITTFRELGSCWLIVNEPPHGLRR